MAQFEVRKTVPKRQCSQCQYLCLSALECAVKTMQHDLAISLTQMPVTQGVIFRMYEVDIILAQILQS